MPAQDLLEMKRLMAAFHRTIDKKVARSGDLQLGTIVDATLGAVTVVLDGSLTALPADVMSWYTPTTGDRVAVYCYMNLLMVLGPWSNYTAGVGATGTTGATGAAGVAGVTGPSTSGGTVDAVLTGPISATIGGSGNRNLKGIVLTISCTAVTTAGIVYVTDSTTATVLIGCRVNAACQIALPLDVGPGGYNTGSSGLGLTSTSTLAATGWTDLSVLW